ncbi:MAG: phosphotransferase family protein [Spirochaetaceae bacterium]|jgi:thiamine kinase-like enzyme|nr:phosphotransferase family protein [Spirochaetaceae bacterium]
MTDEVRIEKLGGLTNQNYLVKIKEGRYVFRFPGEGTENMINRHNEKTHELLANKIGITVPLLFFDDNAGIKVTAYIDDTQTMNENSMKDRDNLSLAAKVLKTLHDCGEDTKIAFNVFDMIEDYEKLLKTSDEIVFYDDYSEIKAKVLAYRSEIENAHIKPVPCHNDPLCENWLRSGNHMYLIDWEYAGMNDGIWDLADVSIEAGLPASSDEYFLHEYFGRNATEAELRRFHINKVFLDFLWSLWGKLRAMYHEEGMEEYALNRYIRAKKNISIIERAQ